MRFIAHIIPLACLGISLANLCAAQSVINLYADTIPNAKHVENLEKLTPNEMVDSVATDVSIPSLTVFRPKNKTTSTAVIICPGGGYGGLLTKREGSDVARAFNKFGATAFVLKYRLPSERIMQDKALGPIQDAQQALKIVRENAKDYGIDPQKIGVMGFSAGGHLAATVGTHFSHRYIDSLGETSLRPDFLLLINPVISFNDSIGHIGSRENLLGKLPLAQRIHEFSNELHVDSTTPPAFLVHTDGDAVVPVENSIVFYEVLHRHGVIGALHIYPKGEHGFLTYPPFKEWFGRCAEWIRVMGYLKE